MPRIIEAVGMTGMCMHGHCAYKSWPNCVYTYMDIQYYVYRWQT